MNRIAKLQELLLLNPADSFARHGLALEYIKIGNDADARKQFEELLEREPGYVGSYYHLGKLLERTGDNDKAIKIYERGMEEAKKAGDQKNFNELMAACEELRS